MSVPRHAGDRLAKTVRGRLAVVCLGGILAASATTGSAWAGSPPEKPLTEACSGPIVGAETGQRVCGTLNPQSSAKVGYYFAYAEGYECTAGAQSPEEPEVEGEDIEVSAELSGLSPHTIYSYCLVATNPFGETFGDSATFKTLGPPEKPLTEVCSGPDLGTAKSWRVCGTLNPEFRARVVYYFAYSTTGDGCLGGARTPASQAVEGEDIAVSVELSDLSPDTTYTYCLVAANQYGETFGDPLSFRTQAEAMPPSTVPASDVPGLASSPILSLEPSPLERARRHLAKRLRECQAMPRKRRVRCRRHARRRFERERRAV